jgi:hypothetical protein
MRVEADGESRRLPSIPAPVRPQTATQDATRVIAGDPDLAAVIDAWPALPEPIKAGIMAMVQSSSADHPPRKPKDPKDQKKPLRG